MATTQQVQLKHKVEGRMGEVLTPQALGFVARLQREFGERRQELLRLRDERQTRIEAGEMPHFLIGTIEQIEEDLQTRRERYGFSHVIVPGEVAEQLAPVVERLAGK